MGGGISSLLGGMNPYQNSDPYQDLLRQQVLMQQYANAGGVAPSRQPDSDNPVLLLLPSPITPNGA